MIHKKPSKQQCNDALLRLWGEFLCLHYPHNFRDFVFNTNSNELYHNLNAFCKLYKNVAERRSAREFEMFKTIERRADKFLVAATLSRHFEKLKEEEYGQKTAN